MAFAPSDPSLEAVVSEGTQSDALSTILSQRKSVTFVATNSDTTNKQDTSVKTNIRNPTHTRPYAFNAQAEDGLHDVASFFAKQLIAPRL